ncbi:hypothetical protein Bbelb_062100 [Branchiostoma belcheri]|nr:hypothetical protein Bbelb_062100 [Branchiostoma belcheri]
MTYEWVNSAKVRPTFALHQCWGKVVRGNLGGCKGPDLTINVITNLWFAFQTSGTRLGTGSDEISSLKCPPRHLRTQVKVYKKAADESTTYNDLRQAFPL